MKIPAIIMVGGKANRFDFEKIKIKYKEKSLLLFQNKYIIEQGHITDTLKIPYYPFTIMMAIGAGMLSLLLFIDLVHSIIEVAHR